MPNDLDPERFTLRQAAQARDDFAQVMDELDFVKELIARIPTRREQAFVPLKIMFGSAVIGAALSHSLVGDVLAAPAVKSPSSLINRGYMHKTLMAIIVALISTSSLANSGHILQVHHGADCVEFALVEDANTTCGPNVYVGGTLNPECTALIPWYGTGTGEGVGQTPLTTSQLPFFIDTTSAIDTAYRLYQSELQLEYAQAGIQGVIVINNPSEVASLDTTSAIGFTVNGTLTCKNISATTGTHTVNSVGNLNTPPSFFQVP